jgi:hypothetical protein
MRITRKQNEFFNRKEHKEHKARKKNLGQNFQDSIRGRIIPAILQSSLKSPFLLRSWLLY